MLHWIERITSAASPAPLTLSSIAQVLVRNATTPLHSQISALHDDPPHILIGTPQAILEVFKEDADALQLKTLSAVVVDEADYLLESIPRLDSKIEMAKTRKKLDRHPSPTKQLLDAIFAVRVQAKQSIVWDEDGEPPRRSGPLSSTQLILSSATLRNHLKLYVRANGWLGSHKDVTGSGSPTEVLDNEIDGLGGSGIQHYALVVSADGDIVNIEGARKLRPSAFPESSDSPATVFDSSDEEPPLAVDESLRERETILPRF